MKSIRPFLTRHFGFQNRVERRTQIHGASQAQSYPGSDFHLRPSFAVNNYGREGYANYAVNSTGFDYQIGTGGLNQSGIGNFHSHAANLNNGSAIGCVAHDGSYNLFKWDGAKGCMVPFESSTLKKRASRSIEAFMRAWRLP